MPRGLILAELNLEIFLDCQIAKLKTSPNFPAIQYINPPPCVGGVVVPMLSVCLSNRSTVYTSYSTVATMVQVHKVTHKFRDCSSVGVT